jgi:hypothetical protein
MMADENKAYFSSVKFKRFDRIITLPYAKKTTAKVKK